MWKDMKTGVETPQNLGKGVNKKYGYIQAWGQVNCTS